MTAGSRRVRAVGVCVGLALLAACTSEAGVDAGQARPAGGTVPATSTPPTSDPSGEPTTTDPSSTVPEPTDEPIPLDPAVREITLGNGLRVFVQQNNRPGRHAELRLAVRAGSAQEEPDQSGVAHYLEHLMFNGTERFPANELVATLRRFGMELGPDINAYTSYDETVYSLSVPLTDPENLDVGLDVLVDWLSAATLDPVEVDKERGVVLDEERQRGERLEGRVSQVYTELFLGGSAYEGREPIGTVDAIETMDAERLRRFYDRWYRPDNAAVIVVGDVDVDAVEAAIRERFEPLEPRTAEALPAPPPLTIADGLQVRVHADPDATTATTEVSWAGEASQQRGTAALRADSLFGLGFELIATRLGDDVARGTASYTEAGTSDNDFVRALHAPSLLVTGEAAEQAAATTALLTEIERVRRYGFAPGELTRLVDQARAAVQSQYDSRDTVQDVGEADALVEHFLGGEPASSAQWQFDWYSAFLDAVTPEEVAAEVTGWWQRAAPRIVVVVPQTVAAPEVAALEAEWAGLAALDVTPREDVEAPAGDLMTAPEPVAEVDRSALPPDPSSFLEPTVLTFPNGARVVLNVTDIVDEAVAFEARSPGGLSLVADADVAAALVTASAVGQSGIADLDPVALDTVLASAAVEFSADLDETFETMEGSASTDDLAILLQLIHLSFTAPRFDQAGLDAAISSVRPYVENPDADPDLATYLAYVEARHGSEPRFAPFPTADALDGIDLAAVERVWRSRFTNASDWVFALSGDFDLDAVTDLARRYIGTLPGTGTTESFVDYQIDPPSTLVRRDVVAGTGDRAVLTLDYIVALAEADRPRAEVLCDLLAAVLTTRLTDHVREELGASYSPSSYCEVPLEPDLLVDTVVQISGEAGGMDALAAVAQDDIADLRAAGPTEAETQAALADLADRYDLFSNEVLISEMLRGLDHPDEYADFVDRRFVLRELDAGDIRDFAAFALPAASYIELRTLPA